MKILAFITWALAATSPASTILPALKKEPEFSKRLDLWKKFHAGLEAQIAKADPDKAETGALIIFEDVAQKIIPAGLKKENCPAQVEKAKAILTPPAHEKFDLEAIPAASGDAFHVLEALCKDPAKKK